MQNKKFSRKIEDFTCENCHHFMSGSGYTNHCSQCFYSKHVDINPGDRANECGGMMKPVAYKIDKKKGIVLTHLCLKCNAEKNNKLSDNDEVDQLLKVFSKITPSLITPI